MRHEERAEDAEVLSRDLIIIMMLTNDFSQLLLIIKGYNFHSNSLLLV